MSTLRQRKFSQGDHKNTLKLVKELDAFTKIPESYQEKSASGGGISILTFILITILVYSEFKYYTTSQLKFDYEVDKEFDTKMKINVDITVAMRCGTIGADILDATNQDVHNFGQLTEEETYFELTPKQRIWFESQRQLNHYLREQYHAVHDLLWTSSYKYFYQHQPSREKEFSYEPDACRIHGELEVNKVAGNLHIVAGQSIPVIPSGHAHLSLMLSEKDYNFSHRINHFSFGESVSGIINPLDGEELVTTKNFHIFQYFIKVVPTDVKTYVDDTLSYQYAVSEKNRSIDHSKGSHGVPGIFIKYDISPLKIRVSEIHRPYWKFVVRLCGIVGGVFAISGILNGIVSVIIDFICCRKKKFIPLLSSPPPTPQNPLIHSKPTDSTAFTSATLVVPEENTYVT